MTTPTLARNDEVDGRLGRPDGLMSEAHCCRYKAWCCGRPHACEEPAADRRRSSESLSGAEVAAGLVDHSQLQLDSSHHRRLNRNEMISSTWETWLSRCVCLDRLWRKTTAGDCGRQSVRGWRMCSWSSGMRVTACVGVCCSGSQWLQTRALGRLLFALFGSPRRVGN